MLMLIPVPRIYSADLLIQYIDPGLEDAMIADVSKEKITACRFVRRCRFCMKDPRCVSCWISDKGTGVLGTVDKTHHRLL